MDLGNSSSWKICQVLDSKSPYPIGTESWPREFYIGDVILMLINVILAASTISLNSITILAYWKSTQLRKKSSYFLIMLLSITDLWTGMLGNAGSVLKAVRILEGDVDCLLFMLLRLVSYSFAGMSLMTSFLLNAERYLSIVHPFFHRRAVTKSNLCLAAAILWCVAILTVNSRVVVNRAATLLTSTFILSIVAVCVYFYLAIFLANRRACKKCGRSTSEDRNSAGKIAKIQDMKLARSCTIVVASAIVCFVPFAVSDPVVSHSYLKYFLRNAACTLAFSSATLNSLVFFWQNRVLRNEARRALTASNTPG
jgi:hypothetical protein